ncbi:hypothetical protein TCAL_13201 [Tigriopus californicus]|uniref:SKA complex subunit 1 n=1 Tax=Tigriopus californicus TaxID=6832 RepID=A0A553NY88_TIGCA|nr:spindle and kinetochore-associated protein 1-like [Tigriopus californicus]TRY70394.1 hypothetical protein TCAL_13201 [Tigriopus californicus]|eukprot:TCALIF_13201-PA protein Name:"Similar to ska1 Spindle and kinetochore-associated protein 1 (Xenopus tropicalis)" AED:0.07 eAED:0.07 QI:149/1/1/1/1/1/5/91/268
MSDLPVPGSVADLRAHMEARLSLCSNLVSLAQDGHPPSTVAVLNSLALALAQMKQSLRENRGLLQSWREEQAKAAALLKLMSEKKLIIDSITQKLPECPYLPQNKIAQGQTQAKTQIKTQNGHSQPPTKKGPLVRKEKPTTIVKDAVSYLTLQEFDAIPKYMLGRLSYEAINQAIDDYNQALKDKYEFYGKGFQSMSSMKDKKRYKEMKALETKETRGFQFLVSEDLKSTTHLKSESARKSIFTILRHFKRVKEVRGPGSILRYCALG